MTADDLARVTAERDAAVAALARVEALADEMEADRTVYTTPRAGEIYADRVRVALDDCASLAQRLAEGNAGGEVAPDFVALPCGCEVVERTPRFGDLPERPTYALGQACDEHVRDYGITDDDLREAIGRAKKAAETRAGDS